MTENIEIKWVRIPPCPQNIEEIMYKLNKDGGITLLNEDSSEKQKLSQLESIFHQAPKKLTKSDKYLIRLVWKRYVKLYQQLREQKMSSKDYAIRRRHYLNMINEICGYY